ncbi:MAG: hypothetical protein ACRCUT_03890 [Spirochaetota bacterium]
MIREDTRLSELFKNNKDAVKVFQKFALSCPRCKGQAQDTIAKVAVNNGLDLKAFLSALNGEN